MLFIHQELYVNRVVALGTTVLLGLLAACGEGQPAEDTDVPEPVPLDEELPEREEVSVLPIESIPMPEHPSARRSFLVATSAGGEQDLSGEWEARAAVCEDPAVLQVLAEQPGFGALLLFQLPDGDRVVTYPIAFAESGAPEPPAAQVGVQLFRTGSAFAYQAAEGEIELTSFDERVSGRFGVTLREITSEDRVRFAGAFDNVVVAPLPGEQCRAMKEALFPADSTDEEEP
jgi:hypothetical protein